MASLSAISKQAAPHVTRDVDLWSTSDFENTPEGSLSYLKHRMYVLRDMIPIANKRKLCQKAFMYYEYRNGTHRSFGDLEIAVNSIPSLNEDQPA